MCALDLLLLELVANQRRRVRQVLQPLRLGGEDERLLEDEVVVRPLVGAAATSPVLAAALPPLPVCAMLTHPGPA